MINEILYARANELTDNLDGGEEDSAHEGWKEEYEAIQDYLAAQELKGFLLDLLQSNIESGDATHSLAIVAELKQLEADPSTYKQIEASYEPA